MKTFGGKVLFLDRGDINTDEIIPAKYLTENAKETLKPHVLEDLKLPGFDPARDCSGRGAIVTRDNFGCGSSREHAPWALELNGINIVIASSFARIFRQNMYNCGLIAAELPPETLDGLFRGFAGKETTLAVNLSAGTGGPALTFTAQGAGQTVPFTLKDFERALVEAGGWVEYAAKQY
jgi:3-isopropylmalate/(R)-2-methylmalate dehydratase small subunit